MRLLEAASAPHPTAYELARRAYEVALAQLRTADVQTVLSIVGMVIAGAIGVTPSCAQAYRRRHERRGRSDQALTDTGSLDAVWDELEKLRRHQAGEMASRQREADELRAKLAALSTELLTLRRETVGRRSAHGPTRRQAAKHSGRHKRCRRRGSGRRGRR